MADVKFIDRSYGKAFVKLLHVKRDGNVHSIREYEVSTLITLSSEKDYTQVIFQGIIRNKCRTSEMIASGIPNCYTYIIIIIFRVIMQISLPRTLKRTRCTCWPRSMVLVLPSNLLFWWQSIFCRLILGSPKLRSK